MSPRVLLGRGVANRRMSPKMELAFSSAFITFLYPVCLSLRVFSIYGSCGLVQINKVYYIINVWRYVIWKIDPQRSRDRAVEQLLYLHHNVNVASVWKTRQHAIESNHSIEAKGFRSNYVQSINCNPTIRQTMQWLRNEMQSLLAIFYRLPSITCFKRPTGHCTRNTFDDPITRQSELQTRCIFSSGGGTTTTISRSSPNSAVSATR